MGWLVRFSTDDDSADLLLSRLWDEGTTGVFEAGTGEIVAGFESETDAAAAAGWLTADRSVDRRTVSIEPAPTAEDLAADDRPKPWTISADGRPFNLLIRAGGVFGHGGHQTTRLAAELLLTRLEPNHRVLDVGTGTGILAVLAKMAGACAVVGMDNDPLAVSVADENAATNQVDVSFGLWTVTEAVESLGGPVDIAVMNVLLPVHRALAPEVLAMAGRGLLITAGYLSEQSEELLSFYDDQLSVVAERSLDGWCAHVLVGRG